MGLAESPRQVARQPLAETQQRLAAARSVEAAPQIRTSRVRMLAMPRTPVVAVAECHRGAARRSEARGELRYSVWPWWRGGVVATITGVDSFDDENTYSSGTNSEFPRVKRDGTDVQTRIKMHEPLFWLVLLIR